MYMYMYVYVYMYMYCIVGLQWTPSILATLGTEIIGLTIEVATSQRLVIVRFYCIDENIWGIVANLADINLAAFLKILSDFNSIKYRAMVKKSGHFIIL